MNRLIGQMKNWFGGPRDAPGGPTDIDAWYARYGEAVMRRCRRILRDETEAMDALQETFLRAHRNRTSFRGDAKPSTWLFAIADRVCLDELRRRKRRGFSDDDAVLLLEAEERGFAAVEHIFDVGGLLQQIPLRDRQIVLHRYLDEMSCVQIADHLDINERTVRRRLSSSIETIQAAANGRAA